MPDARRSAKERRRVVIIGGGFGGLSAARALRKADVDVVLVDRTNHHVFQPLLYQVATAALSPADIASPLRTVLRSQSNAKVTMGEALAIDRKKRLVALRDGNLTFDDLIVAPGARHSYFGHDEWEQYALGLKTLTDALAIRERIFTSFERAERLVGTPEAAKYLTFCIVGGGPTGVEVAGAIAEIAAMAILPDFRLLKRHDIKIFLLEAGPRILPGFHQALSAKAQQFLEKLGVDVRLNSPVTDVMKNGVRVGDVFIETINIIWAPGIAASPLVRSLEAPLDRYGRVLVEKDLSIPGDDRIFVIGDAALCLDADGHPLPALAPVAMQQGRYVARLIENRIAPPERAPFRFVDHGTMTTIGKAKAVAQIGRFGIAGLFAWLLWCFVHIFFLIGFRNRFRVMSEWIWYYLTFRPGAGLIYPKADKTPQ